MNIHQKTLGTPITSLVIFLLGIGPPCWFWNILHPRAEQRLMAEISIPRCNQQVDIVAIRAPQSL